MRIDSNKFTCRAGLLGSLVLVATCTVSVMLHPGGTDGAYSVLNHFMSELGIPTSSLPAVIYNGGLAFGGATLALFMAGLGRHFRTRLGYTAAVFGVLSFAACGLIGFLPINRLAPHLIAAYTFFIAWPVAVGLFTLLIIRAPANRLSKGLIVPGVLTVSLFLIFLALPFWVGIRHILAIDLHQFVRPPFLFAALLEWLMSLSVVLWIVPVSVQLATRKTAAAAS